MTREHTTEKDNPATDPQRRNGQGKHDGVPHKPEEFDVMNPARQVSSPAKSKVGKTDAEAREDRR